jgi:hypothetical protein
MVAKIGMGGSGQGNWGPADAAVDIGCRLVAGFEADRVPVVAVRDVLRELREGRRVAGGKNIPGAQVDDA